jgi:hypothetical protein
MFRVGKGHKVKNVKDGENIRHYYQGETLPRSYKPPKSYIEQKIVIKIEKGAKNGS